MEAEKIYVAELDEWMTQSEFNNYLYSIDCQIDSIIEEEAMRDF